MSLSPPPVANGVQTLKKTRRPYQSRCSQEADGEGFAMAGAALINPWLACRFMQVSVRLCLLPVLINFEKICAQYIFFSAPVFRFFCRR